MGIPMVIPLGIAAGITIEYPRIYP
jgi:hypothetical protein